MLTESCVMSFFFFEQSTTAPTNRLEDEAFIFKLVPAWGVWMLVVPWNFT